MFRYGFDPMCLGACAAYALNRWLLKPMTGPRHVFLHGHFNDMLLMPALLPLFLWGLRRIGLRDHDQPPTLREFLGCLVLWTLLFEYVGPHWLHHGTADLWDALVYALGGGLAWFWWQRARLATAMGLALPAASRASASRSGGAGE